MAKPSKAQITYLSGAVDVTIRFHTIIAEDHEITTEMTKYPAQVGFNVSKHAIKKNRKVSIRGVITNTLIDGAETAYRFGTNNQRVGFSTLQALVSDSIPCAVQTNLGNYKDVIFTKFKTSTKVGWSDAMDFVISGEEVVYSNTLNDTTPTALSFSPVTVEERKAIVDVLNGADIYPNASIVITRAIADINESFSVATKNAAGDPMDIVYERVGSNPSTGDVIHKVHSSDTDILTTVAKKVNDVIYKTAGVLPDTSKKSGGVFSASCNAPARILDYIAEEVFETPLGKLKKSIYGAAYEVVGVNGNQSAGQFLVGLAVECVVIGVVGKPVSVSEAIASVIPDKDAMLAGASAIGNRLAGTVSSVKTTEIYKLTNPAVAQVSSFFGAFL